MSLEEAASSADDAEETPSSSPETEPETELDAAQSEEAQASSEDKPESNKPAQTSEAEEPGRSSKLQKLIDSKYQGDEDKFAEALYEQWNSSAALARELKETKALIVELKEQAAVKPPEPEPLLETDEDYKALSEELQTLDHDLERNATLRSGLIEKFNKAETRISELRGELKYAPDPDKTERELERLLSQQAKLSQDWETTLREDKAISREQKALLKELKTQERRIKESRAEQRQRSQTDSEEQRVFLQVFTEAVDDAIRERGLETNSKIREHLLNTIKAEAIIFLQSGGTELPDNFVQQRAEAYFEIHNLAKKANFASLSASKKPLVQKSAANPSQGLANSSTSASRPKFKNGAEARAWVAKKAAEIAARVK